MAKARTTTKPTKRPRKRIRVTAIDTHAAAEAERRALKRRNAIQREIVSLGKQLERRIAPLSGPTFAFLPEGREDIQRANANLIAAAPELFRFVEAFAACPTEGEVPGHWSDKDAMDRMILTAREIVAKAEGR